MSDPWSRTDALEDHVLDSMADRLEARGRDPRFTAMMDRYLDRLDLGGARTVLDLGCGTGIVARRVATRPDFGGTVLGLDVSPGLVRRAVALAQQDGLSDRCRFDAKDTASIPDRFFDVSIAHTLFSHLEDPLSVLREIARVTMPGGRIAIFDGDYESRSYEFGEAERSREAEALWRRMQTTQPRVMRVLPRLARAAKLKIVEMQPDIIAEAGHADFWRSSIAAFRTIAPESGLLTQVEADAWADELEASSRDGTFFCSNVYIAYILQRPDT